MNTPAVSPLRTLGEGLHLRWSEPADTEKLARVVGLAFAPAEDTPNKYMADTVRRLMRGDYPASGPGDFCLIEDTERADRPVVACACLQSYAWRYEGIPLPIGRPEVVATHPEYQGRGLMREIFAEIHRRSAALGHIAQAIVGIPYYYTQLGYEYALDLGGKRLVPLQAHPLLDEERGQYSLRDAGADDIPFVQECYALGCERSAIWAEIPYEQWLYYIEAWKPHPEDRVRSVLVIQGAGGAKKGFLLTVPRRSWRRFDIYALELAAGASWPTVLPSLLPALQSYGEKLPTEHEGTEPLGELAFTLGRSHPSYEVLEALTPIAQPPDAWYVRVPDVMRLIERLAPVLEARLARSALGSYSGEIKCDLYTGGLRMCFHEGRLVSTSPWRLAKYTYDADCAIPPRQFWQLVFGYRSLNTLRADSPDVIVQSEAEPALSALFPPLPSCVLPLEFK